MKSTKPDSDAILQSLSRLYDEMDAQTNRLSLIHAGRLRCGMGCADCCIDDISVSEVEALNIRRYFGDLLKLKSPHSNGACAFLSQDNSCRIYERRPYVCRTQGLPLHWIEEKDGQTIAFRDLCPHNDIGEPIEQLPERDCWIIGPFEEELAKLQIALFPSTPTSKRIKLRDLFNARLCR